MAGHKTKGSLRSKTPPAPWKAGNPMRPGKTAEDKRIGAWMSKNERNANQAMYQEQHKAKPARK